MDEVRKSWFSGSWYPGNDREIRMQLDKWEEELGKAEYRATAGIVPHAGWYFSGKLAYDAIRRFRRDADVLLILGGHLPSGSSYIHWSSRTLCTPCGELNVNIDLLNYLVDLNDSLTDDSPDNTIEVQLPMIRAVLGDISVVPMRVPPDNTSLNAAEAFRAYCDSEGLTGIILGSTDLTHYGMNYGFYPEVSLENPLEWVKKSDKAILKAMENCDAKQILDEAEKNQSACSAGAAAGSAHFAKLSGMDRGTILAYDTSYSLHKAESFVGYGSVIYGS